MVDKTALFFDRIRMEGNPAASTDSMVICGQARFTVLTARLIRLEYSPTGHFEDRGTFAFPNRHADAPTFAQTRHGKRTEIKTGWLTLAYLDDGKPFSPANLSIDLDIQAVHWTPGMLNKGNLRGTRRTLDQCGDAASLQEGLLSRDGWSLFDDSGSVVWDSEQTWVEARPDDHLQDWYFLGYGRDYKTALADYTLFGGRIPLVPRYVLGAWWSRFWPYHAEDLKRLVLDFEAHEVPLDVLVVDMDWHLPDGWTGYTFNTEFFPDPPAFFSWVHNRNLFVTLNLHPADGVQKHEALYPLFAEQLGFDTSTGQGISFQAADKKFIQNYFELLHHPLEDQGVDFWWLDWQQGESTGIKGLDPLPWLNHLHFQDSVRRGTRPMLYSRWGGLGNHRYPIGFSGDAYATWESLRFQSYFTPTAANVCYGWWSHDIGGHFGATDPELYARWVQFGAVSPCLRLHSTKDPLAERRPWAFPRPVYEAAKAAFQLRYRLLPYLYSTARTLSEQGLSLCYPMYYDYPEAEDAYLAREQYFLGDQLFVAPIVCPTDPQTGLASIDVWIPAGDWIEYTTLETFSGPRWIRVEGDLNRIPMFVKAGGILPMAPRLMHTTELDGSQLILTLFPGANGQFTLYEDDGATEAYRDGACETTVITSTFPDDKTMMIHITGAEEHRAALPRKRALELRLRAVSQPDRVTVNGVHYAGWSYEQAASTLVITLPEADRRVELDIVVSAAQPLTALKRELAVQTGALFVHFTDYATFEDARQQLGTILIVPPTSDSPIDVDLTWELLKDGKIITSAPLMLKNCTSRQIVHSPFADDGSLSTFRWRASVNVTWQGQTTHYHYPSQAAYPGLNRWRTLIYNPDRQFLTLKDVMVADGGINTALPWQTARQTLAATQNLKQPFGLVLLEQERQRILNGQPFAAYASTILNSPASQEAILCVQHVGDAACYLNGLELTATRPIAHATLYPMFPTWMPPEQTCYALSLRQGPNALMISTRPSAAIGWWGVGATLFALSGEILTSVFPSEPIIHEENL